MRVKELKAEGKTVSRKALKSGRASGTASPAGSDVLSRVFHHEELASRSETEATPPETPPATDEELLEGQLTPDDRELPAFEPDKLIAELQDRKANRSDTRELLIGHYIKLLRYRYNGELEDVTTGALVNAFLRGAQRAPTPKERILSLKAYCLTAYLDNLTNIGAIRATLKQILTDSRDEDLQIWALRALTVTAVHYGGGEEDLFDYLDFLIEAIQSNGEKVGATGKDGVMVALFVCWAYAATFAKSLWHQADYAMDAFVEKLDSTDPDTQTVAGECIAYIFECSRAHEGEEGEPFEMPYDPARVASRLEELRKESNTKPRSTKQHQALRSVATSLELGVGPYYTDGKSTKAYGFRLRKRNVGYSLGQSAPVESWHLYHRITLLRAVFDSGLERHIEYETDSIKAILGDLDWEYVVKTDTQSWSRFDMGDDHYF